MRAMLDAVAKVLPHETNVLILGETGTGKDTLAEAIHLCGPRGNQPFVRIDCSTLPADLFESELFGHERGAFTDATERKPGKLELANGGTLYFDEIATLDLPLQAKLLRVLEERRFSRLGGTRVIGIDVRIISSSNRSLQNELNRGSFRDDLFFRLNVFAATIPPLRERGEDIPSLAARFLREAAARQRRKLHGFEAEAMELLRSHFWPGNLRELRNVIERAVVLEEGETISSRSLPLEDFAGPEDLVASGLREQWTLEELERRYIREVVRRTGSNFSRAAKALGINRKTLLEKRRRYGLD